ncbi:hypothetical protein [Sphingobium chungbukense]
MVKSPTSTVHSWRKNGIPAARLDHMKLAAKKARKPWPSVSHAHSSACDAVPAGDARSVAERISA